MKKNYRFDIKSIQIELNKYTISTVKKKKKEIKRQ